MQKGCFAGVFAGSLNNQPEHRMEVLTGPPSRKQNWQTRRGSSHLAKSLDLRRFVMRGLRILWHDQRGQDIAEYAVMLAVILVLVVGTIRLVGSNANTVFSQVASAVQ
jgi:Flp pilus assembly pilin Flp